LNSARTTTDGRTNIPTIFFGGGTPSLMPASVFAEIMAALRKNFSVAPDAEITIEANPGTLDSSRLREFVASGVNRVSIGVQSLRDDGLKFLGRIHSAAQAMDLIKAARRAGVRVSADFIYGLPGQTSADIRAMCREINSLRLGHASLYELSIEPGTPFSRMNLRMPDNGAMAEMYEAIDEALDLPRYEVSNYALPGFECRHNANVWDGSPYLGLGPGAAGRVLIDGQWWETRVSGSASRQKADAVAEQRLGVRARATEMLMTGLRTTRGVLLAREIRDIIDWDFVGGNKELFVFSAAGPHAAGNADAMCPPPEGGLRAKPGGGGNTARGGAGPERLSVRKKAFLTLDNLIVKLLK
jgi:oxygen-independent coproporphyrinogen-3 oxidase